MRLSRRTFLVSSLAGIVAVPGYSRFLEPEWLDVTEKRVPIAKIKSDIRILHLSDFHASDTVPFSLIERSIELGLERRPDLACLTGDFITDFVPEPKRYSRLLRRLSDRGPAFASFGNHDGGAWAARYGGLSDNSPVRAVLEDAGITCLTNDARVIQVRDQPLHLSGVGDLWNREVNPAKAFSSVEIPEGAARVVMAHNPDTRLLLKDYSWDLMLSGHTHGGQIVIPVLGYAPFVPVKDKRFREGLQPWSGRYVHITRGVGNILGIRLNCRPEISLLTLTSRPEASGWRRS